MAISINLDLLTPAQLLKAQAFEAKVEAGKKASFKAGTQVFSYRPGRDGAQTVVFTKGGVEFATYAAATDASAALTVNFLSAKAAYDSAAATAASSLAAAQAAQTIANTAQAAVSNPVNAAAFEAAAANAQSLAAIAVSSANAANAASIALTSAAGQTAGTTDDPIAATAATAAAAAVTAAIAAQTTANASVVAATTAVADQPLLAAFAAVKAASDAAAATATASLAAATTAQADADAAQAGITTLAGAQAYQAAATAAAAAAATALADADAAVAAATPLVGAAAVTGTATDDTAAAAAVTAAAAARTAALAAQVAAAAELSSAALIVNFQSAKDAYDSAAATAASSLAAAQAAQTIANTAQAAVSNPVNAAAFEAAAANAQSLAAIAVSSANAARAASEALVSAAGQPAGTTNDSLVATAATAATAAAAAVTAANVAQTTANASVVAATTAVADQPLLAAFAVVKAASDAATATATASLAAATTAQAAADAAQAGITTLAGAQAYQAAATAAAAAAAAALADADAAVAAATPLVGAAAVTGTATDDTAAAEAVTAAAAARTAALAAQAAAAADVTAAAAQVTSYTPVIRTLTANVDEGAAFAGNLGNDVYTATTTANVNSLDTIDASGGANTLRILDVTGGTLNDTQLAGFRNVQTLDTTTITTNLGANASRAGLNTVNLLDNLDVAKTVNLTGFAGALTVNGSSSTAGDTLTVDLADAGNKSINLGGGQDTVNVTAQAGAVAGGTVVSFASGDAGSAVSETVLVDGPNGDIRLDNAGLQIVGTIANQFSVIGTTAGAVDPAQDRGDFQTVVLGTSGADTFTTVGRTGNVYINAGGADDTLTADAAAAARHFLVGGAGNDTLNITTAATGTVVAIAGGGDDAVNVTSGAGSESITLISGTNTVTYTNGLTLNTATAANNDTLTGGSGRDTLAATSAQLTAVDNTVANAVQSISAFEALTVSDAQNATTLIASRVQAGIDTVSLNGTGVAAASITFDGAVAATLNLGAVAAGGITVVSADTGTTDQVTIANTAAAVAGVATDAFNGQSITATGVETLVINTSAAGSATTQDFGAVTGSTNINFTGSNNVNAGVVTATNVSAAGLTGAATLTMTTSAAATNLTGSANADNVTLGAGAANVDLGGGSDTLNVTDATLGGDTLNGGDGADTLSLAVGTYVDAQFANVSSFQNLTLANGVNTLTLGQRAAAAGFNNLTDSSNNDSFTLAGADNPVTPVINGTGFAGATTITLTGGNDTVVNAANVALTVNGGASITNGDVLTGGSGADELRLNGTYAAATAVAGVSGFETITLLAGTEAVANAGANNDTLPVINDYTLDIVNANVAANGVISIDGAALRTGIINNFGGDGEIGGTGGNADTATGEENLALNASGLTGGRRVSITGGAGADTLSGGAAADVINGGLGNDLITGGDGRDTLVGGAGDDTYVMDFTQLANDQDAITEGVAGGSDTLRVSSAVDVQVFDAFLGTRFANVETLEFQGVAAGGNETFTMTIGGFASDAGFNTVTAGADATLNLTFAATFAANVTVNGGTGNDFVDSGNLSNGVRFNDFAAGGDDVVTTGSGNDTVVLVDGANTVVTGTGADSVTLGTGVDNVNAGEGDDTIVGGANLTDADVIVAGAGNDRLTLAGDITLSVANNLQGVESFVLASQGGGAPDFDYNIALDDGNDPDGTVTTNIVTVDATALATGGGQREDLTFDASTVTGFRASVTGGAGNDNVTGTTLVDTLTGGNGSDFINGRAGNDRIVLTEAAAASDSVRIDFNTPGLDTVVGFDATSDSDAGTAGVQTANQDIVSLETGYLNSARADNFNVLQGVDLSAVNVAQIGEAFAGAATAQGVAAYLQTNNMGATGDRKVVIATNGTNTYVYAYVGDANLNVNATEFTQLTVLEGVGTALGAHNVVVGAVNAAPVVSAGATVNTFTEGGGAVAVAPALTVSDVDDVNLAGATVSITDFVAGDVLTFVNQNGITGAYNGGTGVLTLTGASSVANYQAALRSITLSSTSDNPTVFGTNGVREIAVQVTDANQGGAGVGAQTSDVASHTTNITGVNDAPTLTLLSVASAANNGDTEGNGAAVTYSITLRAADVDTRNLSLVESINTISAIGNTDAAAGDADTTFTVQAQGAVDVLNLQVTDGSLVGNANVQLVQGTNVGDLVQPSAQAAVIFGFNRVDTIAGGAGNDTLIGGQGADLLFGGIGNDLFVVDQGTDQIGNVAGAGVSMADLDGNGATAADNNLFGDATIAAGTTEGVDRLRTGDNVHVYSLAIANAERVRDFTADAATIIDGRLNITAALDAENGVTNTFATINLAAAGGSGTTSVTGTTGNDTIVGADGTSDTLRGGDGNDTVRGGGAADSIEGGNGDDRLFGDAGDDNITGDANDDSIEGGDGSDTLTGGTGADTILGGNDGDTITGSAGVDSLTGGAGNDRFVFSVTADNAVVGADVDTVTDLTAGDLVRVIATLTGDFVHGTNSGVDTTATPDVGFVSLNGNPGGGDTGDFNVILSNNATEAVFEDSLEYGLTGTAGADVITGGINNDTLDGGNGGDTITGAGGNDSIIGGAGNDSLVGGAGDDTFDFADTDIGVDTIVGGNDTDTLRITAGVAYDLSGVNNISGIDVIVINTAGADVTLDDPLFANSDDSTIVVRSDDTNTLGVTVDGAQVNDIYSLVIESTDTNTGVGFHGNDSMVGTQGADTISAGEGNDTITGGLGVDVLAGNRGNDTFIYANAEFVAAESVNGGADPGAGDVDTVQFNDAASVVDAQFANKSNLERIVLANAVNNVTLASNAASAFNLLTVTGGTNADTINVADYNEGITVTGGNGNDTLVVSGARLSSGNTTSYDGGAGTDTLQLSAADNFIDTQFGGSAVLAANSFEVLQLADGSNTVTLAANAAAAFATLTVNGGSGVDTINASAYAEAATINGGDGADVITGPSVASQLNGQNGGDNITGGAGNDTINGGADNDTIVGAGGDDSITGGTGVDSLTGGAANDTFVFAAGDTGITLATADVVVDFATTADTLGLGLAGDAVGGGGNDNYAEAGTAVASFDAALLAANASLTTLNAASTAGTLYAFQFDATNGYLFIDRDSSGSADEVIVLVGIDNTEIEAADIVA